MASKTPTLSAIEDAYKNIGYTDLYSGSIFLCFGSIALLVIVAASLRILQHRAEIDAEWEVHRCDPKYMPLAGFIHTAPDMTAREYTQANFDYCVQKTTTEGTAPFVSPLAKVSDQVAGMYKKLADGVNAMRDKLSQTRDNIREFTENVMARILNITIPLREMIIALMDGMGKMQGILTASLFTMLGSYNTLQSLMGGILELIIKLLVAMGATILGLWAIPPTWGAAATLSAVYLSISIPLAIIADFMSRTLHVHSSGIPKLRCFSGSTSFMVSRSYSDIVGRTRPILIEIRYIQPGDWISVLQPRLDGSLEPHITQVTGKFKVLANELDMYKFTPENGEKDDEAIVSGCHYVHYRGRWIPAREHPHAQPLSEFTENYVYCLSTNAKEFEWRGMRFMDWDEDQLDDPDDAGAHAGVVARSSSDFGFDSNDTVYVPDESVILYGTVSLRGDRWHGLTNTGYFYVQDVATGQRRCVFDYEGNHTL